MMSYRKAQRSARNLYSLAEHLSLRPLKRAVGFTDRGVALRVVLPSLGVLRATSCNRDTSLQARAALSWPFAKAGDFGWHRVTGGFRRRIGVSSSDLSCRSFRHREKREDERVANSRRSHVL